MKKVGASLGGDYKVTADGKIVKDEAKTEARLDVSTRLQRRKSKRIRVKPVKSQG